MGKISILFLITLGCLLIYGTFAIKNLTIAGQILFSIIGGSLIVAGIIGLNENIHDEKTKK